MGHVSLGRTNATALKIALKSVLKIARQMNISFTGRLALDSKRAQLNKRQKLYLKKYGLTFVKTDDLNLGMRFFYESGEKFAVKTGEGNENYWITILQKEESVYSASWLPDPDKILVD